MNKRIQEQEEGKPAETPAEFEESLRVVVIRSAGSNDRLLSVLYQVMASPSFSEEFQVLLNKLIQDLQQALRTEEDEGEGEEDSDDRADPASLLASLNAAQQLQELGDFSVRVNINTLRLLFQNQVLLDKFRRFVTYKLGEDRLSIFNTGIDRLSRLMNFFIENRAEAEFRRDDILSLDGEYGYDLVDLDGQDVVDHEDEQPIRNSVQDAREISENPVYYRSSEETESRFWSWKRIFRK